MNPRRLHYVNGSISSWRVMLALHEKNLAFEAQRMHVMRAERETRAPEFLALNPRGKAPVLVEPEGTVINESLGLLTYLELRYPEPCLLPRDARMGLVLAWVQESEETGLVYEPIEQLFLGDLRPDQREAVRGALGGLEFELSLWESRLSGKQFLFGDALTLADCALYPVLAYLLRRGLSLEPYPALAAYIAHFSKRPSAIAAHPQGWYKKPGRNLFAEAHALPV